MIGFKKYLYIQSGDVILSEGTRLQVLESEALGKGICRYTVKAPNGQRYSFDESMEMMLPIEVILAPFPKPKN